MITTKTIKISGNEIIRDYVCRALNLTTSDYNKQFGDNPPEIYWEVKETGDHDKGTYDRFLKSVEITITE